MNIEKQQQHIIPAVYLKHFAIGNFVHLINYADRYRHNIQRHGVRAKIFCKPNYYDWRDLSLERKFGELEMTYNGMIHQLTTRTSIGVEMKHRLSQWMHMSKIRSEFVRDLIAGTFTNIEKFSFGFEYGGDEMKKKNKEFIEKGQLAGKIFQFEMFETKDYWDTLEDLTKNFLMKEWFVYICNTKNFITSDNPGFSFTQSDKNMLLKTSPALRDYNTNLDEFVVHCYPLTSEMCLCLKPFPWNDESTEEEIYNDIHKDIQYETVVPEVVESINNYTRISAHKMVIGRLEKDLEQYRVKS